MKKEMIKSKKKTATSSRFNKELLGNIKKTKRKAPQKKDETNLVMASIITCFVLLWIIGSGILFIKSPETSSYVSESSSDIIIGNEIQGDLWIGEKSIPNHYKHNIDNTIYEMVE